MMISDRRCEKGSDMANRKIEKDIETAVGYPTEIFEYRN